MKQKTFKFIQAFLNVGQLGLTLITPILVCTLAGVYLTDKFGIGMWLLIVLIGVGFLSSIASFVSFIQKIVKQNEYRKEEDSYEIE